MIEDITRGSVFSTNPVTGITATFVGADRRTANVRQTPANAPDTWWLSTSTTYGTILYTATIVVPAGELWEVAYVCNYYWATDDKSAILWTLNDALLDDSSSFKTGRTQSQGPAQFNQTFILTAGTYVARVKAVIGNGSSDDYIYFPDDSQPSHVVVRKYKSY